MPITHCYNTKFNEILGELAQKVRDYPIIVGGSLVISVIIEKIFSGSDIDFYVAHKLKRRQDRSIDHPFNDFIVNEMGGVITDNVNYQDKSYKYICPDITLNIIHVDCETKEELIAYVERTSDLDICTSTFDGFFTKFPISIFMNVATVINQNLIETTFVSDLTDEDRIEAYNKFSAVFILKRKTRQYKYSRRGFKINGSELDNVDEYNANSFIENQTYKENNVRDTLKLIVDEIKKNVESKRNICLDDILHGRHLFRFRNDAPIISIHHSLDYDNFPWARKW